METAFSTDELQALIDIVCDGEPSAEDIAELEGMLYGNAEAQRYYLQRIRFDRCLRWEHARGNTASPLPGSQAPTPSFLPHILQTSIGFFSQELPFSLLVATFLTALGLMASSFIYVTHHTQLAVDTSSNHQALAKSHAKSVGRITGAVDCRWREGSRSKVQGSSVLLGDNLSLRSGLLEITYDTGAKVILQGPVAYEVDSHDGGYLSVGKLTARLEKKQSAVSGQQSEPAASMANQKSLASSPQPLAPNSNPQSLIPNPSLSTVHSRLFTIKTPTATVTDLGTEFGVSVDREGVTHTVVFVGEVLATPIRRGVSEKQPIRLSAGDAVSIDRTRSVRKTQETAVATQFVRSIVAQTALNRSNASGISFSETFQTAGIQAKTDNTALANYPQWIFKNDAGDKTSFVTVDPVGRLAITHPDKVFSNPTITISAKAISGQAKFDVSRGPLTISLKMGARGTASGWFDARLWVGKMLVDLFPEYGAIRVCDRDGMKIFEESYSLRQNEMCSIVLTIVQNDGKYKINIAHSDDSGVSASNTFWTAKENVGDLDSLSFGCQNACPNSAAFFSHLSVAQESQ